MLLIVFLLSEITARQSSDLGQDLAVLAPRGRDKHFPAHIQAPELGQVPTLSPVLSLP